MNDYVFNRYILILIVMSVFTVSVVIYAIKKDNFFEKAFKFVLGILIIDAILLIVFLIKILLLEPDLF